MSVGSAFWWFQHKHLYNFQDPLHSVEGFFSIMPRGQLNKDEMVCYVLKLKHQVDSDEGFPGEKEIAQKYLNKVLDKIQEYRY